jgi:hypothetical protein
MSEPREPFTTLLTEGTAHELLLSQKALNRNIVILNVSLSKLIAKLSGKST